MGIQQYLIRHACGRGAYDPCEADSVTSIIVPARSANGAYVQHYDRKGRPSNQVLSFHKYEQIQAKNAILETVGVVERRIKASSTTGSSVAVGLRGLSKWDIVKSTPYAVGLFVRTVIDGWIYRLQASFLLGTSDCSLPLADIVWSDFKQTSLSVLLTRTMAASMIWGAELTAMTYLTRYFEKASRPLMPRSLRKKLKVKKTSDTWLAMFCARVISGVVLSAAILAPLTIYADLIAIGVYSEYLPPWRAFQPSSHLSPHYWYKLSGRSLLKGLGPTIFYSTIQHLKDLWEEDDDDENALPDSDDEDYKPQKKEQELFHPSLPLSVAALKIRLYRKLGWANRADGRELFEHGVYSLLANPRSTALRIARSEVSGWPIRGMYLRSVWAIIPSFLGAVTGWTLGSRYRTSALAVLNKVGLCALVSVLTDVGICGILWGACPLIGVQGTT